MYGHFSSIELRNSHVYQFLTPLTSYTYIQPTNHWELNSQIRTYVCQVFWTDDYWEPIHYIISTPRYVCMSVRSSGQTTIGSSFTI